MVFWEGQPNEHDLEYWFNNEDFKIHLDLHAIISWGVYISVNMATFYDVVIPPLTVASQGLVVLSHFPQEDKPNKRVTVGEHIDRSIPWIYFDGASQGTPLFGGPGGILYLSSHH